MHQLPPLISDLALILIVAGVVTILFRWLKQPLVLGYIVAGLLAGPHVGLIPTVADMADISIWADIGVIFLLFALGLEFSFKKLMRVGKTGVITAVTEVAAMFVVGFLVGRALHWSSTDSMFLGGMLSMSSTTIIIKAFDDLDLRRERFAQLVFGVLVVEDLVAVLLMVLLSTLSVSQSFAGGAMVANLAKLIFFLTVCFVTGIYLVPTLLKKSQNLMSDETLLVVSIGLCLVMVMLAVAAGFSSALGAFMMGSILAETVAVERIEHILKPVKDLFGAIFFVSVGMMVSPQVLMDYAAPIAFITLATVVGKLCCSSAGVLLSGQSLKVSIQAGFSLAQIGEFAFIIASLGQSLHVTSDFLYPVVVAVSVVTTFFTPYLISLGVPCYHMLERALPSSCRNRLCRDEVQVSEAESDAHFEEGWGTMLRKYLFKFLILFIILYAISQASFLWLVPFLQGRLPKLYADILAAAMTLLVMAPFLRAMMYGRDYQPTIVLNLWAENRRNRLVLSLLMMVRLLAAFMFVEYVLIHLFTVPPVVLIALTVILMAVAAKSKKLLKWYWRIESKFLVNLNERQMESLRQREMQTGVRNLADVESSHWLDTEMYVAVFMLEKGCRLIGKQLCQTDLRSNLNIFVLRVQRLPQLRRTDLDAIISEGRLPLDIQSVNIPPADYELACCDFVYLTGEKMALMNLQQDEPSLCMLNHSMHTLREFSIREQTDTLHVTPLMCVAVSVDAQSGLLHANLRESAMSNRTKCLVIGLEHEGTQCINPSPDTTLAQHDVVWVIGENKPVTALIEKNVLL